jgi:hypothetical protein
MLTYWDVVLHSLNKIVRLHIIMYVVTVLNITNAVMSTISSPITATTIRIF